jgi:hypothetical protein
LQATGPEYAMALRGGWVADQADPRTATCGRYANHKCYGGNAQLLVGVAGGRYCPFLVALTAIAAGDEVLWDYACSWTRGDPPLHPCYCGHPDCRRWIGEARAIARMRQYYGVPLEAHNR